MVLIPAKMGRINKRALLGRLQRVGQASRADLAKSLGLSQPTAGKIADELLRLGVLEEVDEEAAAAQGSVRRAVDARARVGRPGRILRLNRSRARFLAIQLGVSETNLAALPVGAAPEDRWAVQVKTPSLAEAWVRQLKIAASKIPLEDPWGVLVSVPGIVDEPGAKVLFSPNLHWTESADLPGLIHRVWSVPVELVQEERALALGHQYVDSDEEDFLLVDFGEGVGGAAIVAGKPYTPLLPLSGELGHTPVLGNHRKCGCGAVGCIETLVSMRGLMQSFAAAHPEMPQSWEQLAKVMNGESIPPWMTETLRATAVVISGALNVLGLRRVIVTGTLTELPPAVMAELSQAIVKGAMWARFGAVKVEAAPRRRTAGLVAVGIDRLVLPMEKHFRNDEGVPTASMSNKTSGGWLSYNE
jgi:predicted NBD/HSP70 family sugar kinase